MTPCSLVGADNHNNYATEVISVMNVRDNKKPIRQLCCDKGPPLLAVISLCFSGQVTGYEILNLEAVNMMSDGKAVFRIVIH
jgi:hypothetical protein